MRTPLWIAAAVAITLLQPIFQPPSAAADMVPSAPHELTTTTKDRRTIVVGHRAERVERISGGLLAARKALVSNEAYAKLTGTGTARLQEANLTVGYQVGCAVALASMVVDLRGLASVFGVDPNAADTTSNTSTITVTPQADSAPSVTAILYPGIEVDPEVKVTLRMGAVSDIPMASGPVRNSRALVGVRRTDITVAGCFGPAAIRSYATLVVKSALADETTTVYGDPIVI